MSAGRLMVFARAPEAGRVKTRLEPALGPARAAALHAVFVEDVVERHRCASRCLTVWRSGDPGHPFWDRLAVPQRDQPPGDLGARLVAAFAVELGAGEGPVVVLGSDSPSLPPALVERAFAELQRADVVIGPALDGGYYLIGLRAPCPSLFAGITWGAPTVFAETVARAEAAGLCWRVLAPWYDVDRPADLDLLRAHLPVLARAGDPVPVRTEAMLAAMEAEEARA